MSPFRPKETTRSFMLSNGRRRERGRGGVAGQDLCGWKDAVTLDSFPLKRTSLSLKSLYRAISHRRSGTALRSPDTTCSLR